MPSSRFPDAEVERTTQQVYLNGMDITTIVKAYNLEGRYVKVYVMIGAQCVRTKKGERLVIKITGDVHVKQH